MTVYVKELTSNCFKKKWGRRHMRENSGKKRIQGWLEKNQLNVLKLLVR